MKYIKTILYLSAALFFSEQSFAAVGCATKQQDVENQIIYARKHNNPHQVAGLQKALREIEEHCTEPQLLKQRQLKITEKEKKVAESQTELERARETGKPEKIAQKQKKLEHAQQELQDARSMLSP